MFGQARRGDPRHHLRRAGRPASLRLDPLQALEEAAQVDQQAGQVAVDGIEGRPDPLACGQHRVGAGGRIPRT
ncbi:hypothetical protein ASF41_12090 [Methylobacterium sp. Leaf111]|nr:hypothetical protein ASF41_12090 [Methylobacterium sp. Leaf111]